MNKFRTESGNYSYLGISDNEPDIYTSVYTISSMYLLGERASDESVSKLVQYTLSEVNKPTTNSENRIYLLYLIAKLSSSYEFNLSDKADLIATTESELSKINFKASKQEDFIQIERVVYILSKFNITNKLTESQIIEISLVLVNYEEPLNQSGVYFRKLQLAKSLDIQSYIDDSLKSNKFSEYFVELTNFNSIFDIETYLELKSLFSGESTSNLNINAKIVEILNVPTDRVAFDDSQMIYLLLKLSKEIGIEQISKNIKSRYLDFAKLNISDSGLYPTIRRESKSYYQTYLFAASVLLYGGKIDQVALQNELVSVDPVKLLESNLYEGFYYLQIQRLLENPTLSLRQRIDLESYVKTKLRVKHLDIATVQQFRFFILLHKLFDTEVDNSILPENINEIVDNLTNGKSMSTGEPFGIRDYIVIDALFLSDYKFKDLPKLKESVKNSEIIDNSPPNIFYKSIVHSELGLETPNQATEMLQNYRLNFGFMNSYPANKYFDFQNTYLLTFLEKIILQNKIKNYDIR